MAIENLDTYSRQDVVEHYARVADLMPPERYLFGKYVRPGLDILDIGVGGGRTTVHLAPGARRYLGVDYAPAMVEACRQRLPDVQFDVADATAMPQLRDESFDLAIFSFNGIDNIPSDEGRIAALGEMRRVTRKDGHIIISSHNARLLALYPQLEGADFSRKIWRLIRAAYRSVQIASRNLREGHYRKGHGYVADPVHGGLFTHVSTPESIARDCAAAGLAIVEHVGAFHPKRVPEFMNNWETYVLKRL